ncbi:MAG: AMP-binding enzyme [Spirillospora sp.]
MCAFVAAPPDLDRMAARTFCAEALPDYMVPQELHIVGDLPLTHNGKVDRARLAAMR